jgi:putative ABC transport system permease protein
MNPRSLTPRTAGPVQFITNRSHPTLPMTGRVGERPAQPSAWNGVALTFLLETIRLGLTNLRLHLLRSVLTALGIILGVGAVITMVSLGEGSKQEALMSIERLGARNIIIRSEKPPEAPQQGQGRSWVSSFGLTYADLEVIEANFPDAEAIVPLKAAGGQVLRGEEQKVSQAFGTTPQLQTIANLRVARGRYLVDADLPNQEVICVIGHEIARQFFQLEDPVGKIINIDQNPFTVVGVLAPVGLAGGAGSALVGRDLNLDIHIPITTARAIFGDTVVRRESGSFQANEVQISEVYLSSPNRDRVLPDAQRLRRILEVRRPGLRDVSLIVPFELLDKARKDALTWNLVLGAVAGISLLVGGIGIMNIMLATVTERTREIGVRRALGATRHHITSQFLVETGVLSAIGGLVGVGLGIGISVFIPVLVAFLPDAPIIGSFFPADVSLPTQVTMWSILVAFGVAALTGLVFGIYPALQAAKQDPIVALRHD